MTGPSMHAAGEPFMTRLFARMGCLQWAIDVHQCPSRRTAHNELWAQLCDGGLPQRAAAVLSSCPAYSDFQQAWPCRPGWPCSSALPGPQVLRPSSYWNNTAAPFATRKVMPRPGQHGSISRRTIGEYTRPTSSSPTRSVRAPTAAARGGCHPTRRFPGRKLQRWRATFSHSGSRHIGSQAARLRRSPGRASG